MAPETLRQPAENGTGRQGTPATDHRSSANFLPDLQRELIAVISKYVKVNTDDIRVSLEKQGNYEVLEVNIVLPEKG